VLIVNINPGGPAGGSGTQYFVGEFDGTNSFAIRTISKKPLSGSTTGAISTPASRGQTFPSPMEGAFSSRG
jgi:hypothetical protein